MSPNQHSQPHIAIMGTRGIPAAYGGFETFAEQLSQRLVQRGWQVTVYGRRFLGGAAVAHEIIGDVEVRRTYSVRQKYLETPLAALSSFCDVLSRKVDVILLCNAANSPLAWIPSLKRLPLVINVDGIERERKKWSVIGRLWYRLGEWTSVLFAKIVVADAQVIADYYQERFGVTAEIVAYGADPQFVPAGETLARFGLTANNYILYVSRLEPENNALGVVQAYTQTKTDVPLVVVGDAPYAAEYIAEVKRAANGAQVIFTGFQFGESYRELRTNCLIYIQATEVGGTHPALVEAMAWGNCIIANDVPEHREVLRDGGAYYSKNNFGELAQLMSALLQDDAKRTSMQGRAAELAKIHYSWDAVVTRYESILRVAMG